MAVELAKVALWLHTFTVGAPLGNATAMMGTRAANKLTATTYVVRLQRPQVAVFCGWPDFPVKGRNAPGDKLLMRAG